MKKIILLLLISCLASCKSSKQISINKLIEKGAIVKPNVRNNSYTRYFPYYYLNTDKKFNKIKGDYYNLSHPSGIEINLIVGYVKEYGPINNVLRAQVWIITKNKKELKNLDVKVYSEKNGDINYHSNFKRFRDDPFWVEKLFVKKIDPKTDFLSSFSDDTIYVEINGYRYTFVAPNLNLK